MSFLAQALLKPWSIGSTDETLKEAFRCGESENDRERSKALKLYTTIAQQGQSASIACFNKGVIESRMGNWKRALQSFKQAESDPDIRPVAAFARLRLTVENGQRVVDSDLPEEYRGKNRGMLSSHGATYNAANELRNRGHHCMVKCSGKTGIIKIDAGGAEYMIALTDVSGILMQRVCRVEGENRIPLADARTLTDADREIVGLEAGQLPLVQLPVSAGIEPHWYRRVRTEAERKVGRHGWVRVGRTFAESANRSMADVINHNMPSTQALSIENLARTYWTEGSFLACVLNDEPVAIAMTTTEEAWFPTLPNSVQSGTCVFSAELFPMAEYPVIHVGLGLPVRLLQDGKVGVTVCEHVANFAEANFQDWAAAVKSKGYSIVHVVTPDSRIVASGRSNLHADNIGELNHCLNRANSHAKTIPYTRLDYKLAVGRFYKEYPEPFFRSTRQHTERF